MGDAAAKTAAAPSKNSPAQPSSNRTALPAPNEELGGGGKPLPLSTRARMERSFGRPFDEVRVHEGAEAADAARAQGAEAYTVGNDVAFGKGRYRPDSESGDRLIAHELAHVVQQDGVRGAAAQPKLEASSPGEPAELEAEAAADRVMRGEAAGVRPGGYALSTRSRLMRKALSGGGEAFSAPSEMPGPELEGSEPSPEGVIDGGEPLPEDAVDRESESTLASGKEKKKHKRLLPGAERGRKREEKANENAPGARGEQKKATSKESLKEDGKEPAKGAVKGAAKGDAKEERATAGGALTENESPAPEGGKAVLPRREAAATEGKEDKTKEAKGALPAAVAQAVNAASDKGGERAAEAMAGAGEHQASADSPSSAAKGASPGAAGGSGAAGGGAAPDIGGGGGGGGGGGEGAMADSPEGAATEEKMDAAQPEEEAAAEAAQEEGALDGAGGGAESEVEEEPKAPAEDAMGSASASLESGSLGDGESATAAPPSEVSAPEPKESEEDKAAREAESAPFAEQGASSPESASADDAALSPAEQEAAMSSLAEGGGGGGEGGGGGGGGGGAIADKPVPAVPDVSQSAPADALGQLSGLPPLQISQALSSVGQAVSRSVGEKREALAASPPELEAPTGMPAKDKGGSANKEAVSGGAAEKAEKVPQGESAPTPQPQPTPTPAPTPAAAARAPAISGGEKGEMSSDDVARLNASIQSLPTSDPDLETSAGAAPKLSLEGGSDPGQISEQQAKIDERVAEAQAAGKADIAAPMGEDDIAPAKTEGTLKAEIAGSGGEGGGAGGGADADEAASIVAQEEHGDAIEAAVQGGQADMSAKEEEQASAEEEERQRTREEADRQTEEAAEAQREEKANARAEVDAERGAWSEAQRAAVEKGRQEADSKSEEARGKVRDEKEQAENEASGHIEEGEREAVRAKREGAKEASRQKARADKESGGFFGWVASKAKSFFNSIKEGIKAAIQKARDAVKRAIDAAKKLAREAIEKARQAVVAAIRAAGEALIAIGDVVLAAFPEARDKFRAAIEEKVKAAEEAVNRIADALQKGIQKLLDALGSFLDKALGLLEKGLLAVVDAVNEAVQSAIKAAKAAVDALGTFAQLVKDIAANPGQWLSNLGAAVVDGIKNHLWKALKSAVSEWFNQKLESVLGLGTAVFNLLFKGGFSIEKIGKMAWEALKAAIPMVLIQLLVEKLVSMIVPAAGAVMAIVEGLQAAWGTVSQILQAMDAFITFLKAVKGGGAGPQFAKAAAAGAVAVIEFVANWLLMRLRKPAGKVAGKLKAIAQKILKKVKKALKKVGKALKKAWKKIKKKFKKLVKGKKKGKGKKKDKKKDAEDRLARAERELKPQIDSLLHRGVSGFLLRARLAAWRIRYRLTRLSLEGQGRSSRIRAVVNPVRDLNEALDAKPLLKAALTQALGSEGIVLLRVVREVTEEIMASQNSQADKLNADTKDGVVGVGREVSTPAIAQAIWKREQPSALKWRYKYDAQVPNARSKAKELQAGTLEVKEGYGARGATPAKTSDGRFELSEGQAQTHGVGKGATYSDINNTVIKKFKQRGMSDADIATALGEFARTRKVPPALAKTADARNLAALHHLVFVRETARNRANLATSAMMTDLIQMGKRDFNAAFEQNSKGVRPLPMSMENANPAARMLDDALGMEAQRGPRGTKAETVELARREYEMVVEWLKAQIEIQVKAKDLKFAKPSDMERFVSRALSLLIRDRTRLKAFMSLRLRAFYGVK